MKLNKISPTIGLVASSILLMSTTPAQAFNFTNKTDLGTCASLVDELPKGGGLDSTLSKECTTSDGFKLIAGADAGNAKLQGKEVVDNKLSDDGYNGSVLGVGVSKSNVDAVSGEIDLGEYIDLILPETGVLESIDLSFLYKPGHKGDQVYEVSFLSAGDGGWLTGTLKVLADLTGTGNTKARWSVADLGINTIIEAISASTNSGGGWYSILNPFGDTKIAGLKLSAPTQGFNVSGDSPANNDFSLVGATMKVPEPATLLGLGLVAGAMAASRKRQARKVS
ncbi:PEP-CTERM sorting domain-containing protein [Aerosakkonemataceae cyanobacterium BLCC-F154]|uniref:PEP-CTERM sorting domain-containing protein n=1 Tax=Floridaenema fluviatile BLCC-F154 TaxID=3153640 RepID=A0ABV4Y5K0_9CYAN